MRRAQHEATAEVDPNRELSLTLGLPRDPPPLHKSTRPSQAAGRYGFPNVSLIATLSSVFIPNSYS